MSSLKARARARRKCKAVRVLKRPRAQGAERLLCEIALTLEPPTCVVFDMEAQMCFRRDLKYDNE